MIGALAITEPDGGSDVAGIRTCAVRDGDHYVVNGAKTCITSGVRADFVTTAVCTEFPVRTRSACSSSTRARPGSRWGGGWRSWAGTAPTPPSCPSSTCGCR
ncbi:acyl-CoA dehydrogenase family protein [Micromonospora sp. BRA006-A]|nr:acyl-CoA dehydrogenase family protein [Micromonospora sp. BRA006-A]